MKWFLIYFALIPPPPCGGIDCGINPAYRSTSVEQRMEMPSLEVCRAVRAVNSGSKCITEDVDLGNSSKQDKLPPMTTQNNNLPGTLTLEPSDGKTTTIPVPVK